MRFDHIGLLVPDIAVGRRHLSTLFAIEAWSREFADPGIGVAVQFGRDPSGVCYELVMPLSETSPVAAALAERKRIMHHVAYLVADLGAAAKRLRAERCAPVGPPGPAIAYAGAPIQFFVSPLSFIVELIEAPEHRHAFEAWPA